MTSARSSFAAILDEARAQIAGGSAPEWPALEARIREGAGDECERAAALQQLARLRALQRARGLVREPAPAVAKTAPARRAVFRARPTLAGNMELHRRGGADEPALAWDPAAGVAGWEVRISERPDARSDYRVRETVELPPGTTSIAPPLGPAPLRIHVLGRSADGRLLRRAIVSGLTRDNWRDRWQRRPSAS